MRHFFLKNMHTIYRKVATANCACALRCSLVVWVVLSPQASGSPATKKIVRHFYAEQCHTFVHFQQYLSCLSHTVIAQCMIQRLCYSFALQFKVCVQAENKPLFFLKEKSPTPRTGMVFHFYNRSVTKWTLIWINNPNSIY